MARGLCLTFCAFTVVRVLQAVLMCLCTCIDLLNFRLQYVQLVIGENKDRIPLFYRCELENKFSVKSSRSKSSMVVQWNCYIKCITTLLISLLLLQRRLNKPNFYKVSEACVTGGNKSKKTKQTDSRKRIGTIVLAQLDISYLQHLSREVGLHSHKLPLATH